MTLKEELEILRGEPIQVFTGDPMDIPCIETSDPEKLCKHPVVSVHMITYNHEPYIRQAIEGVMMQKTDFEFELVIGEDCSTDKTREICFEYQKRYPDKIRVLWANENTFQHFHPAGRNSHRVTARCRGEFIAFCEGDDYWIDPLKLQKQVDIMRAYPSVGICFTDSYEFSQDTQKQWKSAHLNDFVAGLILSKEFCDLMYRKISLFHTCNVMYRRSKLRDDVPLLNWRLRMGDVSLFCILGNESDAYYLDEITSVYRLSSTGVTASCGVEIGLDAKLSRMYLCALKYDFSLKSIPSQLKDAYFLSWFKRYSERRISRRYEIKALARIFKSRLGRSIFFSIRRIALVPILILWRGRFVEVNATRILKYLPRVMNKTDL